MIANRLMSFNSDDNIVARLGGDEFALLLDASKEDVYLKLSELENIFNEPLLIDNDEFNVTISAGVAKYPDDGQELRTLFDKADIALYGAKKYETSKVLRYQDLIIKKTGEPENNN